ncbi:MAG: hypothetical protein ACK4MF_08510, partial [Hyphomicrobiaceae bacterium]
MAAHVMTPPSYRLNGYEPDAPGPDAMVANLDAALAAEPDLARRIGIVRAGIAGPIAFSTSLGLEDQAMLHAIA